MFGVTRGAVLELAKKLRIPVEEKEIFVSQIKDFQEAFITASNREITPVVKIDEETVGKGEVGEITKRLIAEFRKITERY